MTKKKSKCESPIEQMLYDAMIDVGLIPICQYQIGKHRVDFVILEHRLVIEADGKDYHQGWRKYRDRRRDTWLRKQGWTVIRFTGAEIWRGAYNCAKYVKERTRNV